MKPDGSGERILDRRLSTTKARPSAPNGRVVMFFRDHGGSAARRSTPSISRGRNEQRCRRRRFASDPAWSPLLS